MKSKILILFLALLVIVATAAASPFGSLMRGKLGCFTETGNCVEGWNGTDINLYSNAGSTSKFSVDGATGNITAAGTLQTTGAQTQTGLLNANGGIAVDSTAFSVADTTGNTVVSGTLTVTSTTSLNDDLNMNAQPILNIGNAGTDFGTDGGLTLAAGLTVSAGASDLASTLQYGTDNLYPLGYASVNQQMVCGTTAEFTETLQVTPTGLTTVTYVVASQITTPAATAAFLTVSDPTTSTFGLFTWEADYTAGTTGITAHYCAVGDQ